MLTETGHFSKVKREDEICGFTCTNDLEIGEVFETQLAEISCDWYRHFLGLQRDNRIGHRHENGRNFHMNECRFSIDNKKSSKLIHFLNVINHICSFTLIRIEFLKVLSIDLKLIFGIEENRRLLKIYRLFPQQSDTLLILFALTSKSIAAIVVALETEIDALVNVLALCPF